MKFSQACNKILLRLACCAVIAALATSCQSVESSWEAAQRKPSVDAYQSFIELYPDSQQSELAQAGIEQLRFNASSSLSSLRDFLAEYPDSVHSEAARSKLETLPVQEYSRALAQLVLRLGPPTHIEGNSRTGFRRPSWSAEKVQSEALREIESLLQAGADPSEFLIDGFEPMAGWSRQDSSGSETFLLAGSPGTLVLTPMAGLSLVAFCREYKLDRVAEILATAVSKRAPQ